MWDLQGVESKTTLAVQACINPRKYYEAGHPEAHAQCYRNNACTKAAGHPGFCDGPKLLPNPVDGASGEGSSLPSHVPGGLPEPGMALGTVIKKEEKQEKRKQVPEPQQVRINSLDLLLLCHLVG